MNNIFLQFKNESSLLKIILFSLCLNAVAISILVVTFYKSEPFIIATVNMDKIISTTSQSLAKSFPKGSVPPPVMEKITEYIKEFIKKYAQKNNCIVLSKESIFSGNVEDITDAIIENLETMES